ncbi:MAG: hypothetical protein LRY42_02520 [Candidatus Pacebacteria bacterium]|nr:hypothetical protein [Candidatus Paceibacterota bacterium]
MSLDIPADARGAGGYLEGSYLCKDMIQKNDVVLQISTEDSPIVTEYAYTYCHNTKDSTILMLRKHDQTLHVFKYVTDEGQEYWSVLARNTRSVYPNKFFPLVPY